MRDKSYYDVLAIQPCASDEEVKRAYHRMAKIYHPDQNPQNRKLAELRFKMINEAYSNLKTREKRLNYDRHMHIRAHNDNSPSFLGFLATLLRPANRSGQ